MKISIITATYNSEATLKSSMLSVLNQSFQNIEYVIIDGNSTDRTLALVKQHQNNFHKLSLKYSQNQIVVFMMPSIKGFNWPLVRS